MPKTTAKATAKFTKTVSTPYTPAEAAFFGKSHQEKVLTAFTPYVEFPDLESAKKLMERYAPGSGVEWSNDGENMYSNQVQVGDYTVVVSAFTETVFLDSDLVNTPEPSGLTFI